MEIWKDINGYGGLYKVSNYGNVKSYQKNKLTGKLLTPKKLNKGYFFVILSMNYKNKAYLIHRLVAIHFLENPNNYSVINHKDENKLNNYFENLEWCTRKYNRNYSLLRKPNYHPPEKRIRKVKQRIEKINQYNLKNEILKTWDSAIQIKKQLSKNEYSIYECCLGKRKTAYGFKWAFAQ